MYYGRAILIFKKHFPNPQSLIVYHSAKAVIYLDFHTYPKLPHQFYNAVLLSFILPNISN